MIVIFHAKATERLKYRILLSQYFHGIDTYAGDTARHSYIDPPSGEKDQITLLAANHVGQSYTVIHILLTVRSYTTKP